MTNATSALVVYESMFGNTAEVARAVAKGIEEKMPVELVEVSEAPQAVGSDVALLVVGAPTHAFSLSRESTRESAKKQATRPLVSQGRGLREWLETLGQGSGISAAAFDTRVKVRFLPGSAAKKARRKLRSLGFRLVEGASTFYVKGTEGPLLEGEAKRAQRWGGELAASALRRSVSGDASESGE